MNSVHDLVGQFCKDLFSCNFSSAINASLNFRKTFVNVFRMVARLITYTNALNCCSRNFTPILNIKHEIETTNGMGCLILIWKPCAYRVTHDGINLADGCLSPMRNNAITLQRTSISSYTTNPSAHILYLICTELTT